MKIGIIARTWFTTTKGGSERYITRLFEELKKKNHEVVVITLDKTEDKDIIQIKLPKLPFITSFLFSILASRKMNKINPEVCLINQYWAEFSPLLLKIPWLPLLHDVGLYSSRYARINRLKHYFRTKILQRVTAKAKLIVVPSKLTAKDLETYLAIKPTKIRICTEGIDLNKFKHKGINILCVSREAPNKGHDILIRAFQQIKQNHPDANLTIVGGNVSEEMLLHHYHLADIYVQPSIAEEGWGICITEAYACRKPVVCTEIFRQTGVADSNRAIIVKCGDAYGLAEAIEKLIVDKELRDKLVESGYRFVKQLCWKKTTNEILEAINSLLLLEQQWVIDLLFRECK